MKDQDLQQWSYNNWMKVPELIREDCLNQLRGWVPPDIIQVWKAELKAGKPIGGPSFHILGGGMSVRNRLRNALTDSELPPVKYPDGNLVHNWDDYYMGAIQQFIEETVNDKAGKEGSS